MAINVPKYLKPLFGNLVFESASNHDINSKLFDLIIKWLLELVNEHKYSSINVLIKNNLDINELLHISNILTFANSLNTLKTLKGV